VYHGVLVDKPFIGQRERIIESGDIARVSRINHLTCLLMVIGLLCIYLIVSAYA
jgi:adenosylcobinamide-phosphate synthase